VVCQNRVGAFAYRLTYIQGWPLVRINTSVNGFDVIILPSSNRRISKPSRTVAFDLILGKRPKPSSTLAALEGICIPAPIYRKIRMSALINICTDLHSYRPNFIRLFKHDGF
jgi:hypothetical protein